MNKRLLIIKELLKGKLLSGQELAKRMSVTRSDIHKHIEKLRLKGFRIESKKNKGYCLRAMPDRDTFENIVLKYPERFGDFEIIHHKKLTSTQSYLKALAARGAREWSIVVADEQTSGYGRLKRKWFSGRGGLWFSILLRPKTLPERLGGLSLVVSLAILNSLADYKKAKYFVKWPNDILLSFKNKIRKVAGIITELSTDGTGIDWMLIGVGINTNNKINSEISDIAASLCEIEKIDNLSLFGKFILNFKKCYTQFLSAGFLPFKNEYNVNHILNGKYIEVSQQNNLYSGKAIGVAADGNLELISNFETLKIVAGDVLFCDTNS